MDRRLRVSPLALPFHIVLVEPEIPPNTGNIARLCAATNSPLHLVGPLGFRIDEHAVKRAGLDYWPLVTVSRHLDFPHFSNVFSKISPQGRLFFFTAKAQKSLYATDFAPGDGLVFGRESVGLPDSLTNQHPDRLVAIPTSGAVRSHNLANAASIALYEALRQQACFA